METDLSQKVLEEIREEKIRPKPRWQFLLKDGLVWLIFSSSIIIGALATAVIIFNIQFSDWEVYEKAYPGPVEFWLDVIPFLWLIVFTIFVFVSLYYFKHTKNGYKYGMIGIVLLSLVSSLILGGLAYGMGLGEKIEFALTNSVPYYPGVMQRRVKMWIKPNEGLLAGKILKIDGKNFKLIDLQDKEWQVLGEKAKLPPVFIIQEDDVVRMIGRVVDENIFEAERIMKEKMFDHMMGPDKPKFKMMIPPPNFERKMQEMRINR